MTLTLTPVNVLCYGGTGGINLSVSGGVAPYTYDWSNNGFTGYTDQQNLTGVPAGSYVVKVKDNNGIIAQAFASITQPGAALSLSTAVTDVSSPGGSNGAIDLTVTGGTPAYSYNWGGGNTSEDRTNLTAGTYSVTVTDANGCTASTSATVGTVSNPATVTKHLYLSDPAMALDRVDPVATSDATTSSSTTLLGAGYTTRIFAFEGNNKNLFWEYSISGNSWTARANAPAAVRQGGAMTSNGVDLFAMPGNNTQAFWRYNVAANTWTTLANTPAAVSNSGGGALRYTPGGTLGYGYIYAFQGGASNAFWRYDIYSNTWSSMAAAPAGVSYGGALAYDGTNIYAFQGGTTAFWRYNISSNAWSTMATVAAATGKGASLVYDGTYIYGLQGNGNKTFWQYNIGTNTWTAKTSTSQNMSQGAALTFDGTYIYALRGAGQKDFYRYDRTLNTWLNMTFMTNNVSDGGALTTVGRTDQVTTNLSFTESTPICQNLTISGSLSVLLYISVISGTMPANPNITATLKYGATTVATLTNPTYNSTDKTLTWTTTIASTTIPSGSVLALTITTAQSGVAFTINYDSNTKPSKISMTASNYITVNSINVYDAPYPSASVPSTIYTNGTYFVRVDVSDPFGAMDINGVNLLLNKPDASIQTVNLGASNVVYTASCSKIYQYTLSGPVPAGTWNIQAIAKEGFEGTVKYSTGQNFTVVAASGAATKTKQLYYNNASQYLDRTLPTSGTTLSTPTLTSGYSVTPVFDASNSISGDNVASLTVSHTTGSNPNRLMLVGVSYSRNSGDPLLTGVTYGGTPLEFVGTVVNTSGTINTRIAIYKYLNPPSGTANVIASFQQNPVDLRPDKGAVLGVMTLYNVNQGTALGSFVSNTGTFTTPSTTPPSVTLSSAANEIVFNVVSAYNSANLAPTGTNQTERWDLTPDATNGGGSYQPGATSTTASWTPSANGMWATGAIAIKPYIVPANTSTTFTENPTLCSTFTIKAGQTITSTNYVTTVSGTIPPLPAVTAQLKDGSTVVANLNTASYSEGIITLTGTPAADYTVAAGGTLSLVVTSTIPSSNAEFKIDYGSSTKISKISIPTNTYIQITSAGIYSAASPSGTLITSLPSPGTTVYIRVTASDPFGTSDITGVDINIGGTIYSATGLTPSGCTKTFEYAWTPSSAGDYSIAVTAKEGSEGTVFAYQALPFSVCGFTINPVVKIPPTCFYLNGGQVSLEISGSNGPFTWSWTKSGGGTGSGSGTTILGLSSGTYGLSVTSAGGCTSTASVTLDSPVSPSVTPTVTDATCLGNDGIIDLTISGGSGSYSFFWEDGVFTQNRTGLSAGHYIVHVTDQANGCTTIASADVQRTNDVSGSGYVVSPSCYGGSNGSINLTPVGGSGVYTTFQWVGPNSFTASTEDISGLAAGVYTVAIADNGGCAGTVSFEVLSPAAIVPVTTIAPVTCYGGGGITLSVTGGITPYTYDWGDLAGTTNVMNRTGLQPGTYNVTVTDMNGCTGTATATLDVPTCDPNAYTVCTSSTADAFSVPYDPEVTSWTWTVPAGATFTGQGTNSILVDWTNAAPSPTASQVCVQGTNWCGVTSTVCYVVYIRKPTASASATVACSGGDFQLSANGGSTYSWSGPNGYTSALQNPVITNASASNTGAYTVTVTDFLGCSSTATVNVTLNNSPTATASTSNVNCGEQNGNIDITPTGGTPGYTYLWTTGDVTEDLYNIGAGAYNVVITDLMGCTANQNYLISSLDGPGATLTPTNVSCYGTSTGSITSYVTGGTAPYTYQWSNGATTANLNNIPAGNYFLTVTDATGCKAGAMATVTQPAPLVTGVTIVIPLCYGASTGSIDLTTIGGTGPYNFDWDDIVGTNNGEDRTNIPAGTYTLTVTDSRSCSNTNTYVVSQPAQLVATATPINISCNGGNTGGANLTVSGGTAPYTYDWRNGSGTQVSTSATLINQPVGTYTVSVTDASNCLTTTSVTVTSPTPISISGGATPASCYGTATGSILLDVSGGSPYAVPPAATPFLYSWSNGASTEDLTNVPANDYTITVSDYHGCTATATYTVTEPAQLSISTSTVNVTCYGGNDGSITLNVIGGTAPYTYSLNSGSYQSSNVFSLLTAGLYNVSVKDDNNCVASTQATITQPTQIKISGFATDVSCYGGADGEVNITVSEGTPGYIFDWADVGTPGTFTDPEDRSDLSAGTYSVTVKDAIGCTATNSFTVNQPELLTAALVPTNISCNGADDGSIDLTAGGGTTPYSFAWSNGAGIFAATEDVGGLASGTFTVSVTDAQGCQETATTVITQPEILYLSGTPKDNCSGQSNGEVSLTATGGTESYQYNVDGGSYQPGNVFSGLASGSYTFTVMDANTCVATASFTLTAMTASTTSYPVSCSYMNTGTYDGEIYTIITHGAEPFTFAWTTGDGLIPAGQEDDQNLIGAKWGTYQVVVTDANGCVYTATATLDQPVCNPPVAVDDYFTSCSSVSGGVITGTVATNDIPGSPYTLTDLEFLPLDAPASEQGLIEWDPSYNGSFTFTAFSGYTGTVVVTYRVEDPKSLKDEGVLTIYVSQQTAQVTAENTLHVNCGATNGSATVTHSGGFEPYSYLWNDLAAQTTATATNLAAGTYTVTVTDAKSCQVTATVTIENICLTLTKDLASVNGNPSTTAYYSVGDIIAYNLMVTNTGTATLTNIQVTDILTGQNATIASLASGATQTLTTQYTVQASDLTAGSVNNTATATFTYNGETYTVQDNEQVPCGIADVAIVKKVVSQLVTAGNELIYELTVTNLGPATAYNVQVTDNITAFPNPVYSTTINGTYAAWSSPYSLPPPLPKDNTYVIYIKGTLPSDQCSAVTNTATVSSAHDNNSSNDSSTISTGLNVPNVPGRPSEIRPGL
jgi:uncharacterized repeat protein (TIGR01451 family)